MSSDPAHAPDSGASVNASGDPSGARGSRLISRLLPPAIRLWLHTQLDHIEGLEFAIDGKDRQILGGYLPGVTLVARQAVYRGLHLSQAQVSAADIRVNLPQVLRGKPLRLLQPFPVEGQVTMLTADLRASLQSSLLGQGLRDVLTQLLAGTDPAVSLDPWLGDEQAHAAVDIALETDRLTLRWPGRSPLAEALELTTGLIMQDGRWLCLRQPVMRRLPATGAPSPPVALADTAFDLGPEVNIRDLSVGPEGIDLVGLVRVIPAD
ncbi:DUF2993 domain-containing protein [Nodosilinea sp. E11]|uniref:LmeA family phospholipid-binding protein n=1 Tax=Nodosilinea sp. E11 TaxID=3037479 RepID=UPI002934EEDA|nr:DUF2993 domain-containing protein [Nodosilinea sp. E11]WOD41316.1 DUF2993 domain-containing protein [Nodosilinea sp. E11]